MKKTVAITGSFILVVVIISIIFIFFLNVRKYNIRCTLINNSTIIIKEGEIEVYDKQFKFENLHPGESFIFSYTIGKDEHYLVKIEFVTGKRIIKGVGYITYDANVDDLIEIRENNILFSYKELKRK